MGIHCFPSEFVYWDTVENHTEIKEKLLPIILENSNKTTNNPFDSCKLNTSLYLNNPEKFVTENNFLTDQKILNSIVFRNIDNMLNKYNILDKNTEVDFILKNCWWNVYGENEYQEEHNHYAEPIIADNKIYYPSLSLVYILHDENEKSSLIFKRFGTVPLRPPSEDECLLKTEDIKEIKEGTVLIFPCSLRHLVKPCIKPGRVTIAYNIYTSYQRGYL